MYCNIIAMSKTIFARVCIEMYSLQQTKYKYMYAKTVWKSQYQYERKHIYWVGPVPAKIIFTDLDGLEKSKSNRSKFIESYKVFRNYIIANNIIFQNLFRINLLFTGSNILCRFSFTDTLFILLIHLVYCLWF